MQKLIVTAFCLFMLAHATVLADRQTAGYEPHGQQAMDYMNTDPGAPVYDTGSGGERDQPGQESRYFMRNSGGQPDQFGTGHIDTDREERIDRYVRRDAEIIPDENNGRFRQNHQGSSTYFQPRPDTPPSSAGTGSLNGKKYRYHARAWQQRKPVYRKRARTKRHYHSRTRYRRKLVSRNRIRHKRHYHARTSYRRKVVTRKRIRHTRRYHARNSHRRKVAHRKQVHTKNHFRARTRHRHKHKVVYRERIPVERHSDVRLAKQKKPRRKYQRIHIRRSVLRRALRTPVTGYPRINLGVHGILALSRQRCHRLLRKHGVRFTALPFKYGVRYPIQLDSDIGGVFYRHTGNSNTFSIVDCRLAVSLLGWSQILRRYGIYEVIHMRTYSPGAVVRGTDKPSGHSWALAIDAALFRTDRYGTLDIKRNWTDRRKGISPCHRVRRVTDGQSLLRALVCDTARSKVFGMILTPHFNRDHHDHLHLEIRPRSYRLVLR